MSNIDRYIAAREAFKANVEARLRIKWGAGDPAGLPALEAQRPILGLALSAAYWDVMNPEAA